MYNIIDEEFANLKIELYYWNKIANKKKITKYHRDLILCI